MGTYYYLRCSGCQKTLEFCKDELELLFKDKVRTAQEQLIKIRNYMGLNILDMASILHVSRPTVYEWLNSQEKIIHKKNQERLNIIYEIAKKWKEKKVGKIDTYVHKPIGTENTSLFSLLTAEVIDFPKIEIYMQKIGEFLLKKNEKYKEYNTLMEKHNFKSLNKEEIKERLKNLNLQG